ncbi:hypothetical protein QCA50_013640 [Cerrena zonata]|uniref:Uncharacterized protein n=1 Tax=Cerrena zonata TaxID=2478898 RepID=A0AAW0FNW2_9APHY
MKPILRFGSLQKKIDWDLLSPDHNEFVPHRLNESHANVLCHCQQSCLFALPALQWTPRGDDEDWDYFTTPFPIYRENGQLVPPSHYATLLEGSPATVEVMVVRHFDVEKNVDNFYLDVQAVTVHVSA